MTSIIKKNDNITPLNIIDVSVIVCAKNAADTIVECLKSIKKNNPKEIILVDANSDDNTQELAKPYVTKVVEDPGLGLAVARNYGLDQVTGKYVCNVGPDNVLPPRTLKICVDTLIDNNYVGVSTETILKNETGLYLSYAMNLYKKARFYPGTRLVIGTPHLFITELVKKHKFDPNMHHSDDSDLCYRLSGLGYTFGIADAFVYEIGMESMESIKERWGRYGQSDFEYYTKYSKEWNLQRKIKSLLHPYHSDFLIPLQSKRLKMIEKTQIIPFLLVIMVLRYISWINHQWQIKHCVERSGV